MFSATWQPAEVNFHFHCNRGFRRYGINHWQVSLFCFNWSFGADEFDDGGSQFRHYGPVTVAWFRD